MKKNGSMVVMMAMLLMTLMGFTACGDDDEATTSGGVSDGININGTDYRMSREVTWEGSWKNGEGDFYVPVLERVGNTDDVLLYQFKFKSSTQPKVGDDFSKMALSMVPLDNKGYNYMLDGELPYITPTAQAELTTLGAGKHIDVDPEETFVEYLHRRRKTAADIIGKRYAIPHL